MFTIRRTQLITRTLGIGIAVASLSACGGVNGPTAPATTTIAPTTTAVPTTVAPSPTITVPASTTPAITTPPVTTPPVTTPPVTTPPVTAGSLDLGDGVSVPVAAGWSGQSKNGLVTMTDGRIAVSLLVVKRPAGEHPKAVIDEYIALLIDKLGVVDYSPANREWTTETPRAAMQYQLFYSVLDAQNKSTQGGLSTFVRDDGLVLLYDVWAPTGTTGALPDTSFQGMLNSFLDAPLIATPVVLTAVPEFQVTSVHPQS